MRPTRRPDSERRECRPHGTRRTSASRRNAAFAVQYTPFPDEATSTVLRSRPTHLLSNGAGTQCFIDLAALSYHVHRHATAPSIVPDRQPEKLTVQAGTAIIVCCVPFSVITPFPEEIHETQPLARFDHRRRSVGDRLRLR